MSIIGVVGRVVTPWSIVEVDKHRKALIGFRIAGYLPGVAVISGIARIAYSKKASEGLEESSRKNFRKAEVLRGL